MPDLTRRRYPERPDCWHVYYGDVHVGTISKCVGNPGAAEAWQWRCGFYPGSHPGEQRGGTAGTFDQARAEFETAWRVYLPKRSEADFQAWRDQQAWRRKSIAASIVASGCRRIGGLVKCDRHRDSWMAPRIYLVGQRFGYLTVTKQVESQLYQWRKRRAPLRVPQYEVKCDCGRVKITKAKLLRNGSVKKLWVPAISGQNLSCTRRQALVVYAFQRQRSLTLGKLLEIVGKLQPACRINGAASLARFLPAYLGLPSEPVRIVDVHGNPR